MVAIQSWPGDGEAVSSTSHPMSQTASHDPDPVLIKSERPPKSTASPELLEVVLSAHPRTNFKHPNRPNECAVRLTGVARTWNDAVPPARAWTLRSVAWKRPQSMERAQF